MLVTCPGCGAGTARLPQTAAISFPSSRCKPEEATQPLVELHQSKFSPGTPRDYHHVEVRLQLPSPSPKPLPDPSLESISAHCVPDLATGRDPEPPRPNAAILPQVTGFARFLVRAEISSTGDDHEIRMGSAPSPTQDPTKITGIQQTIRPPKTPRLRHESALLGRNRRREPLSTFGSSSLDHGPACLRLHARPETVLAESLDPTRLKSPLHFCGSSAFSLPETSNRLDSGRFGVVSRKIAPPHRSPPVARRARTEEAARA